MPEPLGIAAGRTVTLHIEIRLQDGEVAISTFEGAPIHCVVGDGSLAPGLESALAGLGPGPEETIIDLEGDLFGTRDPDNLHWLESGLFPTHLDPQVGQVIRFVTPGGHETSGIVLALEGERVQVDLNHPLAGRALMLRVQVLAVE